MNLNIKAEAQQTYDAIVVGSGITGGYAAKELTEKGLRVIMLERGHKLEHVTDYENAMKHPWDFEHHGKMTKSAEEHYYVQRRTGYIMNEAHIERFVKDDEFPYIEHKRFDWNRGNHVGGRSIMWGRQSYRWSDTDFEANLKDGHGSDWPIRYKDLAPWYDKVERFVGVSGQKEGLAQLPDGQFLPPMNMNVLEKHLKNSIESHWKGVRNVTMGRTAHLTDPQKIHTDLGRSSCQFRDLCMRGCPYGGYFSTQAATLPAAMKTKRLTLRPNSIVQEVIYDPKTKRAKGVRMVDETTGKTMEFYAKIIFLNASTVASTGILLNSKSSRFPDGMTDSQEVLGHYMMDHHLGAGGSGIYEGFDDYYVSGRRANGIYIPRYRNFTENGNGYVRGFGYQGGGSRESWSRGTNQKGFGAAFKAELLEPGRWQMWIGGFGEILPYKENRMWLSKDKTDKSGMPMFEFEAEIKENEKAQRKDMMNDAGEMLHAAGFATVNTFDGDYAMGKGIHEMGTARMGNDSKTSVFNKWGQHHQVKNLFCSDGSVMASGACVNPSLTYMALTARAADYAIKQLNAQNL